MLPICEKRRLPDTKMTCRGVFFEYKCWWNIRLVEIAGSFFTNHLTQGLLEDSPLLEQVVFGFVLVVVHRALAEE